MIPNLPQITAALEQAGIPYTGIEPSDGTIHYAASATATQIQQGNQIVANFTGSSAATYLQQAQRTPAENLLSAIDQSGAAALIRALVLTLVDQINVLRTKAGLTTITAAQARQAILSHLQNGDADS